MYRVVFENKCSGSHFGVRTWGIYKDKKNFDKSMKHPNMKAWYNVVKEGVESDEEAIRLCEETKEVNQGAFILSMLESAFSDIPV